MEKLRFHLYSRVLNTRGARLLIFRIFSICTLKRNHLAYKGDFTLDGV